MSIWVLPHTVTPVQVGGDFSLTLLHLYRLVVIFGDIEVDLRLSVVVMLWLKLKPPVECIRYPYWMYSKCFSTLIFYDYEWAYGSSLTLLHHLYRLGVDFRGYWGRPEPE